jgi:hypothetical protein
MRALAARTIPVLASAAERKRRAAAPEAGWARAPDLPRVTESIELSITSPIFAGRY